MSIISKMSTLYKSESETSKPSFTMFEEFFGALTSNDVRADEKLSHETYNLPKAYEGKNKRLEDVLDFMIRKEDEFYTSRLLPWSATDDIHVQWEIFRFNRTLMDVEPEQGIPRLVTAETEHRSDNLLRRGLAFIIEHGFMTTDRGRRHFMLNLQQITDAVHTTAYFGVMHALLNGKNHYKEWRKKYKRYPKRARNVMRDERNLWAIVQKSHKGLYLLDAELKHSMQLNGVIPNTWVFPPKMSIYLDMVPEEQTQFQLKGQQAAGNLEIDRSQQGISWRGTSVFEAQSFDVDFVNDNLDMLQRNQQIGEYFVLKAPKGDVSINVRTHFRDDGNNVNLIEYADGTSEWEKRRDDLVAGDIQGENSGMRRQTNGEWTEKRRLYTDVDAAGPHGSRSGPLMKSHPAAIHIFSAEHDDFVKITYAEAEAAMLNTQSEEDYAAIKDVHRQEAGSTLTTIKGLMADLRNRIDQLNRFRLEAYETAIKSAPLNAIAAAGARAAVLSKAQLKTLKKEFASIASKSSGETVNVRFVNIRNFIAEYLPYLELELSEMDPRRLENIRNGIKNIRIGVPGGGLSLINPFSTVEIEAYSVGMRNQLTAMEAAFKDTNVEVGAQLRQVKQWLVCLTSSVKLQEELVTVIASANGSKQDIIIFRPFQTYRMSSAILAAGGSELGETFHGHHDFQLSDDIIRKVHVGHYTHYSKSVVKRPKRYAIAENVFAQGYVGGEGVKFYTRQTLAQDIEDGTQGSDDCLGSLIAWGVPADSTDSLPPVIDITGKFATNHAVSSTEEHFPGSAILADMVSNGQVHAETDYFFQPTEPFNTICCRGAQYTELFSRGDGDMHSKLTHLNQGHWGELTYAGCMKVREGTMMHMDKNRCLTKGDKL
jgi:hypothetical protein